MGDSLNSSVAIESLVFEGSIEVINYLMQL